VTTTNFNKNYFISYQKRGVTKYDFPKLFINKLKKMSSTSRLLDAGVGSGNISLLCKSINKLCEYYGIDIGDVSGVLPSWIRFKAGSLVNIPFQDNFFDAVICNQVIEHMQDPLAAMNEIRRILIPGGWCYIAVPSNRSIFLPSLNNLYADYTHIRAFSRHGLTRLIEDSSLQVFEIGFNRNKKTLFVFPYLFIKSILTFNFDPISHFMNQLFGGSIYVIASK